MPNDVNYGISLSREAANILDSMMAIRGLNRSATLRELIIEAAVMAVRSGEVSLVAAPEDRVLKGVRRKPTPEEVTDLADRVRGALDRTPGPTEMAATAGERG